MGGGVRKGMGWRGEGEGDLDLLAEDDLDFGGVLLRDYGFDGGVDRVEHLGGELEG